MVRSCAGVQAEVIHEISIEKAQFSVNADREALLCLVDRLFTSRPGLILHTSPHCTFTSNVRIHTCSVKSCSLLALDRALQILTDLDRSLALDMLLGLPLIDLRSSLRCLVWGDRVILVKIASPSAIWPVVKVSKDLESSSTLTAALIRAKPKWRTLIWSCGHCLKRSVLKQYIWK